MAISSSQSYICELCDDKPLMTTLPDFLTHLSAVHQISADDVRAAPGRLVQHVDASEWHETARRFSLPDGRAFLTRVIRVARRGSFFPGEQPKTKKKRKGKRQ